MSRFSSFLIFFTVIVSLQAAKGDTEIPTSDTIFSGDEGYEDDDLAALSEIDSDFTIIYDNQNGYKAVPLSEMLNSDEIILAFDAARDVRFELYTPKNPNQPQLLTLDNYTTVEQSHFNWLHNTRMLIHGW